MTVYLAITFPDAHAQTLSVKALAETAAIHINIEHHLGCDARVLTPHETTMLRRHNTSMLPYTPEPHTLSEID